MSVVAPDLDGLAGLGAPPGTPEVLRAAAREFLAVHEALRARRADLEAVVDAVAPADWFGPAANGFRAETRVVAEAFTLALTAVSSTAVVLGRYAAAMEGAQGRAAPALEAAADLRRRAVRWEQDWDTLPPTGQADPDSVRRRAVEAEALQTEAAALHGTVAEEHQLVGLAAESARRQFQEIAAMSGVGTGGGLLGLLQGLALAANAVGLLAAVRDGDVARRAPGLLSGVAAVAGDYRRIIGGPGGEQAWRAHTAARFPRSAAFLTEGVAQTFGRGRESLSAAALAANDAAGRLRPLSRFASRVLGPVAVLMDARTVFKGSGLEGGWDVADRTVAGISVAAGVAATGAAFGLLSLTPPGAVAVSVILGASAAWNIGKWGYQNREEIAEFMVDRWDDATDLAEGVTKATFSGLQKLGSLFT